LSAKRTGFGAWTIRVECPSVGKELTCSIATGAPPTRKAPREV